MKKESAANSKKPKMSHSEAGRLGGISTSIKYGVESLRCPTCGHLMEKSEFHAKAGSIGGSIGGRKVLKLYGREHFSKLGKMGGRPRNEPPQVNQE
jgi:hypothetical protein